MTAQDWATAIHLFIIAGFVGAVLKENESQRWWMEDFDSHMDALIAKIDEGRSYETSN